MSNNLRRPSKQSVLLGFFVIIVFANVFLGKRLHDSAAQRTEIKEDYAQINSFRYGLLSIDAWKANIQKIVTERLEEFQLTKDQKKILQEETTNVLNSLLAEADKVAKKPDSGLGKIKASFAKSYIKAARQNLSRFSGTIIDQIEKPATLQKLKQMALEQFNTFAASTHSSEEDVANLKALLAKNHVTSVEEFNTTAQQKYPI